MTENWVEGGGMWLDISFRRNGSDDGEFDLRLTYFGCHRLRFISNMLRYGAVFEYHFEVLEGGDGGIGDISIEE